MFFVVEGGIQSLVGLDNSITCYYIFDSGGCAKIKSLGGFIALFQIRFSNIGFTVRCGPLYCAHKRSESQFNFKIPLDDHVDD